MIYHANFSLLAEVNNLEAAQDYLTKDDMTKFLVDELRDYSGMPDTADKIVHVEWVLETEDNGYIEVETNEELTDEESAFISEWISGQNSDGLGEGFEQQPFANYEYVDEYSYGGSSYNDDEDDEDYYDEEYVMASFDWTYNDYPLKRVK